MHCTESLTTVVLPGKGERSVDSLVHFLRVQLVAVDMILIYHQTAPHDLERGKAGTRIVGWSVLGYLRRPRRNTHENIPTAFPVLLHCNPAVVFSLHG